MKTVHTVVGRPYAITTSASCSVSTPEGMLIATCEPGLQVIFVAPSDKVLVSDESAHVTETFRSAASSASGGGVKKTLEELIEQKSTQFALALEEVGDTAGQALELAEQSGEIQAAHVAETELHLQSGERAKWNMPIPTGVVLPAACESLPGFLLCNGAAVRREEYAELFAVIGTRYGEGDATTTFNLPDMSGRTLWGASADVVLGTLLEAGLPNITGGFGGDGAGTTSGAFLRDAVGYYMGGDSTGYQISFDASRSSAIYGASDTVQPPATVVNFFIKF